LTGLHRPSQISLVAGALAWSKGFMPPVMMRKELASKKITVPSTVIIPDAETITITRSSVHKRSFVAHRPGAIPRR
jgi:hypothetical protein